jgi:hypothetical protein
LCNAQAASETDASEDFEALEELLRWRKCWPVIGSICNDKETSETASRDFQFPPQCGLCVWAVKSQFGTDKFFVNFACARQWYCIPHLAFALRIRINLVMWQLAVKWLSLTPEKSCETFFYHTTTQPVILPWDNYIVLRVAPTSALPPTKCMPCQSICACAINLSLSVSFLSKAQWHHLAAGTWQNLKTDAAVPSFAPLCCSRNKLSAE